jgi:tetrahydromethanopterin S-methyltransferase subunit G
MVGGAQDRRQLSGEEARLLALEIEVQHVTDEVKTVKACLDTIDEKLDRALVSKADWEAVTTLTAKVDAKADAVELAKVNEALNQRLPLWATVMGSALGAVIGALSAALYFVLNYYH